MDFEFKQGDKFDPSRNAVVRTEMDEKGVLNTTYITLNPHLVGWSLLPGIGIKSPAPEDKVLLTDGSIIDLQHKTHTSSSGAVSELIPDKEGNIVIDMQAGGDLILKENADGVTEFKAVDAEKPSEPPKPVKPIDIDETLENVLPFLTETPSKTKPSAVNLMDAKASYEFKTHVPVPGKKTKASIVSTITVEKNEDVMFSTSNGTSLNKVVDPEHPEVANYFLEFVPNAELMSYLEKEGKSEEIEITPEGKVKFQVDKCHFSNANGFHVTALGGKIRFDTNAVSSVVTLDDLVFASQHTQDGRGANITLSSTFIEETYSGKNEVLKSGMFKRGQSELHDIDYTKVTSKMPIDTLLALANLGEADKNGIKRYGDEHSNIQIFLSGVKNDKKGSQSSLMLVRIGEEHYVYHNCELIKLKEDRTCELFHDKNRVSMRFSPEQGGADVKGNQIAILGYRGKGEDRYNETVFAEANAFLGKLAATKKSTLTTDVTENVTEIRSNEKRNINVNTELVAPTIEPIKNDDRDKRDDGPQPPPPQPEPPKDDKKKKTNFWGILGNALLMTMAALFVLGIFTGGFGLTTGLAIAFGLAGYACISIGRQGGFGATIEKVSNFFNKKGKDKDKGKEKTKHRTRDAKKYKARQKKIEKKRSEIAKLQTKLDEYTAKGLGNSKEAKKLKSKIKKLDEKATKLEDKNENILLNASSRTLLDMMGDRPELKDITPTSTRPDFDTDSIFYKQLVENYMTVDAVPAEFTAEDGTVYHELLPTEDFDTLAEMTTGERALLWDTVSDLDDKYGEKTDLEIAKLGVARSKIFAICEKEHREMNDAEKIVCEKFERTISSAKKDLGSAYDSWISHISENGKIMLEKDAEIKSTYGFSADAPRKLQLDIERKKQIETELSDASLTEEKKAELNTELTSLNKSITSVEKKIKKYVDAEMSAITSDTSLTDEQKLEELKKFDGLDFDSPEFASRFEEVKYRDSLIYSPISRRVQLLDRSLYILDSKSFAEIERATTTTTEHETTTTAEHSTEHETTAETEKPAFEEDPAKPATTETEHETTSETEHRAETHTAESVVPTETPVFEEDPTKPAEEVVHEETAEIKKDKKKKKTARKKTERTTGK